MFIICRLHRVLFEKKYVLSALTISCNDIRVGTLLFASKVWGESKDYFEGVSVRFSLVQTSILLKTHRLYVFLRFSRFLYVLKSCSEQFCCMVLHSFAPWFGVSPNFMWSYFARVLNSLHVWTPTFLVTFEAIFCSNNIWNFLFHTIMCLQKIRYKVWIYQLLFRNRSKPVHSYLVPDLLIITNIITDEWTAENAFS